MYPDYDVRPDHLGEKHWSEAHNGLCSRCERQCGVRWSWRRQQWLCADCTKRMGKCWGKFAGQSTVHPCDAPIER